jgi:predicted kinase
MLTPPRNYRRVTPSNRRFLVQMAGSPGAGKSVLARRIGSALSAVVLDKDIIKTGLLEASVKESKAGGAAYEVLFGLADGLLEQGLSVVLDSPSYYDSIPTKGLAIAGKHGAEYVFVDCACSVGVMRDRIRVRTPMLSQGGTATRRASVRPASGLVITADTEGPVDAALGTVLEAIGWSPYNSTRDPNEPPGGRLREDPLVRGEGSAVQHHGRR